MNLGRLYLIPVPLTPSLATEALPQPVIERARQLRHLIAENAKSARAFLKSLPMDIPLQQVWIEELNEHTPSSALAQLIEPLLKGIDIGLISEAGCPAVADPGSNLVALAHRHGIQVLPLIGPSSILLALMGSGLSGQNFAFHGYLPAKDEQRHQRILELEKISRRETCTQIFIETPYRNRRMFESLVRTCNPSTRICIATDLTSDKEKIATHTTAEWRRLETPAIDRHPTVFLLLA